MRAAVAMTPGRILEALHAAAGAEPPVVGVHLSGGQVVSGQLIAVADDRGHEVVVLADPRTGRLAYALMINVIAVELANPEPFADVVTAGRLPVLGDEPDVTRMALRREFGPDSDFPVGADWGQLPGSGPMTVNLARLLRGLREAVEQVRVDEIGRQAWERVPAVRVEHRDGAALSVARLPDGLTVTADLAAALPRDVTGVLTREINALL
jgi:hypothetical protein